MAQKKTTDTSELKIETRSLDSIIPYARNPRPLTDKQIDGLAASIQEFGYDAPIIVDGDGVIIAGHARYAALKKLGRTTAPVVVQDQLTPAQAKARRLIDNRQTESRSYDAEMLELELEDLELDLEPFNVSFEALVAPELEALEAGEGVAPGSVSDSAAPAVVEDEAPEAQEKVVSWPGDLWLLGDHRVLCGDSSKSEDVERLLNGTRASCVFTDPPYGVSIAKKNATLNACPGGSKGNTGAGRITADIVDDDLSPEELKARLLPSFTLTRQLAMAEDCSVFMTAPQGGELGTMMMMMMQEAGLRIRHVLIWMKNHATFSMNRLDYDYQHEPILFTWGKRHKRPMRGQHKTSVWQIAKPHRSEDHPTMKPVELYANAYLNHTEEGEAVYEPYAGSGTAFAAAEQLKRKCYGLEIEPKYIDVIVRRWEKLTGREATLESTGQTFAEVAKERA